MSEVDADANRKAALNQLRFSKGKPLQNGQNASSSLSLSSTPSYQHGRPVPPTQSRDASLGSRYFPPPPPPPGGVVYVPDSSPLASSSSLPSYRPYQTPSVAPQPSGSFYSSSTVNGNWNKSVDLLSKSSGFITSPHANHAGLTRLESTPSRRPLEDAGTSGEPPRKRANHGNLSPDPLYLFDDEPTSPDIQLPGQRRKVRDGNFIATHFTSGGGSPSSSAGSPSEHRSTTTETASRPRIVRGQRPNEEQRSDDEDPKLKVFKIGYPVDDPRRVIAAYHRCKGDTKAAAALLDDRSFQVKPPGRPPTSSPETPSTIGRVRDRDEEREAERAERKERGKHSLIYANRGKLVANLASSTTPPPTSSIMPDVLNVSPTPASPVVVTRPGRRALKRAVIDSGSEEEEDEPELVGVTQGKQVKDENYFETMALQSFNSHAADALRELTGCTPEQARKIISLRPFKSVEDLEERLGQRRKKAGPASISPRMLQDVVDIYQGYGKVDNILEDCERIGAELKKAIAAWTHKSKRKEDAGDGMPSRESSTVDEDDVEDGALNLHTLAISGMSENFLVKPPSLLADGVQLKEYQLLGVNWLNLLYTRKLSCILADEMGLGKTVQVISFFAYLKENGCKGPHLIVVPSSTLENWCREFARFAPSISVQTYYAGKEERPLLRQTLMDSRLHKSKDGTGWEVLITTYALANGDEKDRKFFRKVPWNTCVYDEGHVLKNFQSQRYTALMKIEASWKVLLTGTPLQNNLQELVSLMNFILPNHFEETMGSLRAIFKVKGDSKVTLLAEERVSRAKKMMTPFVLRRRKDQVLKDLPKKTLRIEWCEMTLLQKTIYRNALQRSRKTIFDLEGDETAVVTTANGKSSSATAPKKQKGATRTKEKVYLENSANVLMDLRKAACHPMLFRTRFSDDALTSMTRLLLKEPDFRKRGAVFQYVKEDMEVMTDSELQAFCATYKSIQKFSQTDECFLDAGKVKAMLRMLEEYKAEGRRCLIFSQFTQVLDILQVVLNQKHIKYLVLTGSTAVDLRQALVDEFTEDESIQVFLLSTKAGGMGINLTAASVVIMFDQDFNPHNDRQAADRAYRIGQKRDVEIVKLITRGTIEEDMLKLGETKLALDEAVAGDADEPDVKGESQQEKVMKTSLMQTLRKQLDHEEVAGIGDVKMDVDAKVGLEVQVVEEVKGNEEKKQEQEQKVIDLESSSDLTDLEE